MKISDDVTRQPGYYPGAFRSRHEANLFAALRERASALDREELACRQRLLDGAGALSDGDETLEAVRARAEFCHSMAAEWRSLMTLFRQLG